MKKQIYSIRCPHCNTEMQSFYDETAIVRNSVKPRMWKCKNCVYVWDERFFDTFFQFEHCVTRKRIKSTYVKLGYSPWNKGLTKETDERLKSVSEKLTKRNK